MAVDQSLFFELPYFLTPIESFGRGFACFNSRQRNAYKALPAQSSHVPIGKVFVG